jgi:hypothetical protein
MSQRRRQQKRTRRRLVLARRRPPKAVDHPPLNNGMSSTNPLNHPLFGVLKEGDLHLMLHRLLLYSGDTVLLLLYSQRVTGPYFQKVGLLDPCLGSSRLNCKTELRICCIQTHDRSVALCIKKSPIQLITLQAKSALVD